MTSKLGLAVVMLLLLNTSCSESDEPGNNRSGNGIVLQNRQVVQRFFAAIEAQEYEVIRDVFAVDARQVNPYAPVGFPPILEGSEAIYNQFSGLTALFSEMRFPNQIFATEDPNFFFVKFRGDMEFHAGCKYENEYLGTFRLEEGKIIEYTEYFDPIVLARAFDIPIN